MKWFVIDGLRKMVCHSGMDGMDHNGDIFAKVCHNGMIVWTYHGSMRELVCNGVQWHNGLSWVERVKRFFMGEMVEMVYHGWYG